MFYLLIDYFLPVLCARVALPYWRQNKPPGDKQVNEEEDVEFDCQADGIPRPKISWFINGVPIECTHQRIAVLSFLFMSDKRCWSTQPSIPPKYRLIEYQPVWLGLGGVYSLVMGDR